MSALTKPLMDKIGLFYLALLSSNVQICQVCKQKRKIVPFLYCHSKICCNIKCRSNWGFIVSLLFIKDYSIMWWVFVFLLKVLKCIGDFNFDQNN